MIDHPFHEYISYRGLRIHLEVDHGIEDQFTADTTPRFTDLSEMHEEEHRRFAADRKTDEN